MSVSVGPIEERRNAQRYSPGHLHPRSLRLFSQKPSVVHHNIVEISHKQCLPEVVKVALRFHAFGYTKPHELHQFMALQDFVCLLQLFQWPDQRCYNKGRSISGYECTCLPSSVRLPFANWPKRLFNTVSFQLKLFLFVVMVRSAFSRLFL